MAETLPPGFTTPVCQALLAPMTWNGAPRNPAILNALAGLVALVAWHWWWYVPIALGIHAVLRLLASWDPYFLQTLGRALRSHDLYEV